MCYTALHGSAHISTSPPSLLLLFPFLHLHPSHTTRSHLRCALVRSAPLFGEILYTLGLFVPKLNTLLEQVDSVAPGAPGLAFLVRLGSEGEHREEGGCGHTVDQVRASSSWGRQGATAVAEAADGFPSRAMPWDLRAFQQLELETLPHLCPLGGAALILVSGQAAGHQWLHREEWAP